MDILTFFNGRAQRKPFEFRLQSDFAFWGGAAEHSYALRERLFQVWNHKSSGVVVILLRSRSLQNTAWLRGSSPSSCFNARWQKENGPKFHGTPCLVRDCGGWWGTSSWSTIRAHTRSTHTQVRVSALDLSARLYPLWVGALEPLVVCR